MQYYFLTFANYSKNNFTTENINTITLDSILAGKRAGFENNCLLTCFNHVFLLIVMIHVNFKEIIHLDMTKIIFVCAVDLQ